ncbi:response regulator [Caldimonas sp.]|uniref:response regulator n=1 Tax=Caldimonas sp. TaxID=2838790 RepID=UPI0039198AD2
MSMRYRVAVQGFSAFERSTFQSFFRLAARRQPAYDLVEDLHTADLVIADADQAAAVSAVRDAGRLPRCLFIGAHDVGAGLGRLPRPINLMNVLRLLDEMSQPGADPQRPAAPPASPRPAPSLALDAMPAAATGRSLAKAPAGPEVPSGSDFSNSVTVDGDERFDHILVVDDSDIALRFMQTRLKRFGFKVHLARSGEEALERIARQPFEFVFLDVMMAGMDGYQTCKAIKRKAPPPGRRVPVVVMLTSRAGPVDRIRGTLAGCDAYLTKPLSEDELVRVISTYDAAFQRGFENTAAD